MNRDSINVALLGFGTVGTGVVSILQSNAEAIAQKVGLPVKIYGIADIDLERSRPVKVDKSLLTTNTMELVEAPEVDILVEVIGGEHPALEYILAGISRGKSIVTSNKELIAKHGQEILAAAATKEVDVCFEGSVGGGIPVLHCLKESLAGNQVEEIVGIVNGTTNYILTKMSSEGREFEDVLREAQQLGYAETDPSDDIDGNDAAYKLCILASIAFANRVTLPDVYKEGISKVTKADIGYAQELGYVVKLLAIGKAVGNNDLELRVHPTLLPSSHPLTAVGGVFNAIFVRGDAVGEIMLYGKGAGSMPTGSAVVGDIMDVARNIQHNSLGRILCTCREAAHPLKIEDIVTKYYIRMKVQDQPGVLGRIATIFGNNSVSIASVMQKAGFAGQAEIVWVTHKVRERFVRTSLAEIEGLPVVMEIPSIIRVEGTD